jgi:hypothetical protein
METKMPPGNLQIPENRFKVTRKKFNSCLSVATNNTELKLMNEDLFEVGVSEKPSS